MGITGAVGVEASAHGSAAAKAAVEPHMGIKAVRSVAIKKLLRKKGKVDAANALSLAAAFEISKVEAQDMEPIDSDDPDFEAARGGARLKAQRASAVLADESADFDGGCGVDGVVLRDTEAERLEAAQRNLRASACTIRVLKEEYKSRPRVTVTDLIDDDERYDHEWLPLWGTAPSGLSHLGVGVSLYFELLRTVGGLFLFLIFTSILYFHWYTVGSMSQSELFWEHINGVMSLGNLGSCPLTGCSSEAQLRGRCLYSFAEGCDPVQSVASTIDALDAFSIAVIVGVVIFFKHAVVQHVRRRAQGEYDLLSEYTVFVKHTPKRLEGDEGTGYMYALDPNNHLVRLALRDLRSDVGAEWEPVDKQELPIGPIKSLEVDKDMVYVLTDKNALHRAHLASLRYGWRQLPGASVCCDGEAEAEGYSGALDCVRIYRDFMYAVGQSRCLLRARMPSLLSKGGGRAWEKISAGSIITFAIEGDTVYAVDEKSRLVKQGLHAMTLESSWQQLYAFAEDGAEKYLRDLSCIFVEGGFIYAVDAGDHRLYRQELALLRPDPTAWLPATRAAGASEVLWISAPTEPAHQHYASKLGRHFVDIIQHSRLGAAPRWPPAPKVAPPGGGGALGGGFASDFDFGGEEGAEEAEEGAGRSPALDPNSSTAGQAQSAASAAAAAKPSGRRLLNHLVSARGGGGAHGRLRSVGGVHSAAGARTGGRLRGDLLAGSRWWAGRRAAVGAAAASGPSRARRRELVSATDTELRFVIDRPVSDECLVHQPPPSHDQHPHQKQILALGLRLRPSDGALVIEEIIPGGTIEKWNEKHQRRPEMVVHIKERIVEVNGIIDDPCAMRAELTRRGAPRYYQCPLCQRFWKRPDPVGKVCPYDGSPVELRDLLAVAIDKAIAEIVLVKDLHGAVEKLLEYSDLLVEIENTRAHIAQARRDRDLLSKATASSSGGSGEAEALLPPRLCEGWEGWLERLVLGRPEQRLVRKKAALKKQLQTVQKLRTDIQTRLREPDHDRAVVGAFVTFSSQMFRQRVVKEYKPSVTKLGRLVQRQALRFRGRQIEVQAASEPGNLYWENMDFPKSKRTACRALTCFLTLALLSISSLIVAAARPDKLALQQSPSRAIWVLEHLPKGSGAPCLRLCGWTLFTNNNCIETRGSSTEWEVANIFDAAADDILGGESWEQWGCTRPWASPACDIAEVEDEDEEDEQEKVPDFVAIRFAEAREVKCMRLKQLEANVSHRVQLWACPDMDAPSLRGMAARRNLSALCAAMKTSDVVMSSQADADGGVTSGNLRIAKEESCDERGGISLERGRATELLSDESFEHPDFDCFCRQQFRKSKSLVSPPYDTPEKLVCERWSKKRVQLGGRMLTGVATILIVSAALISTLDFIAQREHHNTESGLAKSLIIKLFFADFINVGLIPPLAHQRVDFLPPTLEWIRSFGLATGRYHEPNTAWFPEVGTTIVLAVLGSSVGSLLLSVLRVLFFKYVYFWIASKTQVTEASLEKALVYERFPLQLRLASNLVIWGIAIVYGAGMPILYPIGFLFTFAAYWVDKAVLLRGSSRPPAYSEEIIVVALDLVPLIVILHAAFSALIFSNQDLLPSGWSSFADYSSKLFGMSLEEYEVVQRQWRHAESPEDFGHLYWRWAATRGVDFGRDGAWRVAAALRSLTGCYILYLSYLIAFQSWVRPFLSMLSASGLQKAGQKQWFKQLEPKVRRAASKAGLMFFEDKSSSPRLNDIIQKMNAEGLVTSYAMGEHPRYAGAADAIRFIDELLQADSADSAAGRPATHERTEATNARTDPDGSDAAGAASRPPEPPGGSFACASRTTPSTSAGSSASSPATTSPPPGEAVVSGR